MITNGKRGTCDFMERRVQLFEAAKKYDVFIVLSSRYCLHTFWMVGSCIHSLLLAGLLETRIQLSVSTGDII